MVIFHSYVSLPEATAQVHRNCPAVEVVVVVVEVTVVVTVVVVLAVWAEPWIFGAPVLEDPRNIFLEYP